LIFKEGQRTNLKAKGKSKREKVGIWEVGSLKWVMNDE
jgi:hypothetical protein